MVNPTRDCLGGGGWKVLGQGIMEGDAESDIEVRMQQILSWIKEDQTKTPFRKGRGKKFKDLSRRTNRSTRINGRIPASFTTGVRNNSFPSEGEGK